MQKAVSYYRVSTERQGFSRLGLEAQQTAVRDYVRRNDLEVLEEYTEIESGRNKMRPGLLAAINHCKKHNAILLIAKIDRLARNVAFVSALMESKIDFMAVDMPYACKLVVHIMAAFAEHEADQISSRTKAALQAAKQRGIQLGKNGKEVLSKKNREASILFAVQMTPVIRQLKKEGYNTVRSLTDILNERKIYPYQGSGAKWHPTSVYNLLGKIQQSA